MPRLSNFDDAKLAQVLAPQHAVVSAGQARACGMTEKAVRYRTRPGGPWQVALPGVYATHPGSLSDRERAAAAWLYAGRPTAVTGLAAVTYFGIPARHSDFVDVLVPLDCVRRDAGFVRMYRTGVPLGMYHADGVVRFAPPERAVADAVRRLTDMADVRALVAAAVQRGHVQVCQLQACLDAGPIRGSAKLRAALAEVADGVRSVAEGDLRSLIKKARLPNPFFNPRLYVGSEFLASPDAWWPEAGVAVEVDSRAYHLSPASWEQTLARQARMVAEGILVIALPPQRIRSEGWKVAREIRSALERSRGPLPHITTMPVSGTGNVAAS
jgi:hypothetical protein